ncbi:MAG: hypothetical protein PVI30_24580 [Myxococcales bacterium]|jgi:hypothetical protein
MTPSLRIASTSLLLFVAACGVKPAGAADQADGGSHDVAEDGPSPPHVDAGFGGGAAGGSSAVDAVDAGLGPWSPLDAGLGRGGHAPAPGVDDSPADAGHAPADAGAPDLPLAGACEVGIIDADTGACFEPHDPSVAIPLVGIGQAELLAELSIRARVGRGVAADLLLTATDTGRTARVTVLPDAFECSVGSACAPVSEGRWCSAMPVWIETRNLVDDPFDLQDLPVTVEMTLRDADGPLCTHRVEGTLHRR